jgi:hypothetical protein
MNNTKVLEEFERLRQGADYNEKAGTFGGYIEFEKAKSFLFQALSQARQEGYVRGKKEVADRIYQELLPQGEVDAFYLVTLIGKFYESLVAEIKREEPKDECCKECFGTSYDKDLEPGLVAMPEYCKDEDCKCHISEIEVKESKNG